MSLDPASFARLDAWTPFLIAWIAAFTVLHCVRFALMRREGAERRPHSTAITELAGLPLALLQTDGFIRHASLRASSPGPISIASSASSSASLPDAQPIACLAPDSSARAPQRDSAAGGLISGRAPGQGARPS